MREIKFRQWNGEKFHYLGMVAKGKWSGVCSLEYDENPIMQFTGLKDKNEKDIYEGDIIKKPDFINHKKKLMKATPFIVEYEDGGYFAKSTKGSGFFHISLCVKEFKIIGNIYKNPELLK